MSFMSNRFTFPRRRSQQFNNKWKRLNRITFLFISLFLYFVYNRRVPLFDESNQYLYVLPHFSQTEGISVVVVVVKGGGLKSQRERMRKGADTGVECTTCCVLSQREKLKELDLFLQDIPTASTFPAGMWEHISTKIYTFYESFKNKILCGLLGRDDSYKQ